MNWANYPGLRPAGCLPCCTPTPAPPVECACALLIPPFASPYADYATAEAAIASDVVSCLVYSQITGSPTYSSYTATFDGTTLALDFVAALLGGGWFSVSLKAGSTLSVPYSVTYSGTVDEFTQIDSSISVYLCDGTGFYSDSNQVQGEGTLSGTFSILSDSVDQTYYIFVIANSSGDPGAETITASFDVTCDDVFTVNPVIALWDDSGTTRQLEACPKMLIPVGTEVVGDWYADETAASDAITALTRGCCAYFDDGAGIVTFTASGVNTDTLSFTADIDAGGFNSTGFVYASVMAEDGESITLAWTGGVDSPLPPELLVIDTTFTAVGSATGTSPLVVSSLPYTGRYIVRMLIGNNVDSIHVSATLTSSGTMLVLPIQALYDVGLDCPSRLDCS
jgi:hypothetical protein